MILVLAMAAALLVSGCSAKMAADESPAQNGYSAQRQAAGYSNADYAKAEEEAAYDMPEAPAPDAAQDSANSGEFEEKIIYNVSMSLECNDVDAAVDSIKGAAKGLGGYVSYSNSYKSGGIKYASIQVRVPFGKLEEITDFVKTLGDVPNEYMSTEDITDRYYDIVTRLEHEEKQEEQLLELLGKAETIEDILRVRAELDTVQANIESYKGTIKRWDSLVDYSTVDVSVSPIPSLDNDNEDGMRLITLGETGRAMVRVFKQSAVFVANAFSVLLRVLSALIIPAAIVAPIVLLIAFLVRRSRKKKAQKNG